MLEFRERPAGGDPGVGSGVFGGGLSTGTYDVDQVLTANCWVVVS